MVIFLLLITVKQERFIIQRYLTNYLKICMYHAIVILVTN